MKKITITFLIICLLLGPVFAAPGYDPGIRGDETTKKGEYKYKEVVFVSGEPVPMEGTVTVTESSTGTKTTLAYKLANTEKNATLDRKVIFNNAITKNTEGNQITYSTTLDPKFSETIKIGADTFVLSEYKLSRSGLSDERAVMKYLVSDWNGRKVFTRNSGSGQVVIDIDSHLDSYSSYWSSTDTAIINNTITYRYKETNTAASYKEIVGSAQYAVSNSSIKYLEYIQNGPSDISFRGGYLLKESKENIVSYIYDLPTMKSWVPTSKRNNGKDSYKMTTMPTQTRLMIPDIKDVTNTYWAAEDIKRLVSLNIISNAESNYYRPLNNISRGEFTSAIVKAAYSPQVTKPKTYEMLFDDVEKNHPYFSFINMAVKAGIINGTGKNKFSPDEYLTKAQAAAIIVRAMGLENSSTESSTATSFADDYKVPGWAKKSINIAYKMGIVTGNEDNEIEPDKVLTRAECAAMINRFIKYLQYDIRKEYREKIINFGQ